MKANRPAGRRWLRFSLRSLLAVVTLICIWLGYAKHWIRQRHDLLYHHYIAVAPGDPRPRAPGGLWMLGEKGIAELWAIDPELAAKAQEAFPEARVELVDRLIVD